MSDIRHCAYCGESQWEADDQEDHDPQTYTCMVCGAGSEE